MGSDLEPWDEPEYVVELLEGILDRLYGIWWCLIIFLGMVGGASAGVIFSAIGG